MKCSGVFSLQSVGSRTRKSSRFSRFQNPNVLLVRQVKFCYCGKPTFNCGLMLAGLPGMSAELAWLSRALATDTGRCKSRQKNQTQFGKYAVIKVCKLCRNWVDVNAGYRKVIPALLSVLCSGTSTHYPVPVDCRLSRACELTTEVCSQGSQGSSFIMSLY